ncbi:hypothetical protein BN1095_4640001 [Clostridioides difficile]|uniref:Uncharacterized protein n=1 Tax=Clostridioides difficile TaxID=1496 RepID=A0A069AV25_CLODI|nr:hypothetical protein BN1095_4640001 [Clostridioides difficile]
MTDLPICCPAPSRINYFDFILTKNAPDGASYSYSDQGPVC